MILAWVHKMFFGSLRRQLIFGVAVVNTIMMAWFVTDLTRRQEALFLDRQAEQATALAQSLATASNHWLAAHDISGLQELIEAQRHYPELRFAMLLDREGLILAHTDRSRLGQFVLDLPILVQKVELIRNQAMVDVVVPVMMSGRHVGWARIGLSQLLAGQKVAEITRNGMLYAFVSILFASLIAWLMAKRLTRRLSHIQTVMDEVRSGNNRARSQLGGMDEAADLSAGFNTMLNTLEERETERKKFEDTLHFQTVELEEEVAERQMAQESLQEQATLLEEEVEKRQKAQDDLEQLNENLEQRVQERTAELDQRNAEIQQAYDDLKKVQAQLLQQDKMASVGQLAAGVAHEINNPMGYIISNLGSLGKYVEKMSAYLDADEKVLSGCDQATREMAAKERQKYKIDHIRRDMPDLISESSDGAQRVRQIVQDLKSFSRMDSAEFAHADITEGLESTLSIAWNELKYKATVIKEYGQLPLVWCNMGQLNQVFLNLLVNAAHAITDHGEIRIATWEENGTVRISIRDTGSGIQPENLKRIFDPFYTTKEVGKGTGLGLAIAYDIVVNKHGGRIDVTSEVGVGTTFTIMLPKKESAD